MRYSIALTFISAATLALGAPLKARAASKNTLTVLKFADVLEKLETQFYAQAMQKFQPQDFNNAGYSDPSVPMGQMQLIGNDEATHAKILEAQIQSFGDKPVDGCTFDFGSVMGDVKTFMATARLIENVGVSAYLGAAALIDDPQILTSAATIATVEARHQTVLNMFNAGSTVATPFDLALTPPQVLTLAAPFIKGCDLGIKATPAIKINNQGTVAPGTKLDLSSDAFDSNAAKNMSCQMVVGGQIFAIAQDMNNCVVPDGIDGLVYLFATKTNQPLLVQDISNQNLGDIVAGPSAVFIDTRDDKMAKLVAPSGSSSSSGSSNGGDNNNNNNGGNSNSNSGSSSSSGSGSTSTTTLSPASASALISSMSMASASSTASGAGPTAAPDNAATRPQPTGQAGNVKVVAYSTINASALSSVLSEQASRSASSASVAKTASATATATSTGSSSASATGTSSASSASNTSSSASGSATSSSSSAAPTSTSK